MSISGINSAQNIYQSKTMQKFTKIPALVPNVKKMATDTVTLSAEAKELPQLPPGRYELNDPRVQAILESIALPDWFGALLPKEAILDPKIGAPVRESIHYTDTGIDKKEIVYCITKLSDVFCEEALKTGISSAERYYMKTSQPDQFKEYDEKLHQTVRDRLLEDGQYVKYMKYLEITI